MTAAARWPARRLTANNLLFLPMAIDGRGTLQLASVGLDGDRRAWKIRQERMSPGYTTDWDKLPIARA